MNIKKILPLCFLIVICLSDCQKKKKNNPVEPVITSPETPTPVVYYLTIKTKDSCNKPEWYSVIFPTEPIDKYTYEVSGQKVFKIHTYDNPFTFIVDIDTVAVQGFLNQLILDGLGRGGIYQYYNNYHIDTIVSNIRNITFYSTHWSKDSETINIIN